MVRTMPKVALHRIALLPPSLTLFIVIVAIFSLLSVVAVLCGSHKSTNSQRFREEKTVRLGTNEKPVSRLQNNISSKALLLAKMISWRKGQDEGDQEEHYVVHDDDDEAIWKKTIIKGEKCRPLDFSGKILYDSNGNRIPDSPHPLMADDHDHDF